jgi:hypothetical protein
MNGTEVYDFHRGLVLAGLGITCEKEERVIPTIPKQVVRPQVGEVIKKLFRGLYGFKKVVGRAMGRQRAGRMSPKAIWFLICWVILFTSAVK